MSSPTTPTVVLVHSMSLDRHQWDPLIDQLTVGRQVIAYDLRGHGDAAGAPAAQTMDDYVVDLLAILDTRGLDTVHAVGHSMGGAIVLTAALAAPERFASLALLATTDHPYPEFADRAAAIERDGVAALVEPMLARWFTANALARDEPGVRRARETLRHVNAADWAATLRAYSTLNVQERLGAIAHPTLVVAGDADVVTPPAIMRPLAQRIPNAVYRELPGAPHMLTLEQPKLVAEALDAFLPRDR